MDIIRLVSDVLSWTCQYLDLDTQILIELILTMIHGVRDDQAERNEWCSHIEAVDGIIVLQQDPECDKCS